jgi:hypothetical protein
MFASRRLNSSGVESGTWRMNLEAVVIMLLSLSLFVFERNGYIVSEERVVHYA